MKTPKWALQLADDVCSKANVKSPPIVWRRARYYAEYSSGYTYTNHIVICAVQRKHVHRPIQNGKTIRFASLPSKIDHKLVLLHELAHWLTPNHNHDTVFWRQAWALYREYKLPSIYTAYRENNYRNKKVARQAMRYIYGR